MIFVGREVGISNTVETETQPSVTAMTELSSPVMEFSSSECQSEVESMSVDRSATASASVSGNCECQFYSNVCVSHQPVDLSQSKRLHSHLSKETI